MFLGFVFRVVVVVCSVVGGGWQGLSAGEWEAGGSTCGEGGGYDVGAPPSWA